MYAVKIAKVCGQRGKQEFAKRQDHQQQSQLSASDSLASQVKDQEWIKDTLAPETQKIENPEIKGYLFIHNPTILAEKYPINLVYNKVTKLVRNGGM